MTATALPAVAHEEQSLNFDELVTDKIIEKKPDETNLVDSRLVQALRYMTEHFPDGPVLKELAAQAFLSQFHFHRRFTAAFGTTPKDVLTKLQMRKAKKLMPEGTHTLAEIAKECGFAHQSHFCSRFKQVEKKTPTQWMREQRNAKRMAAATA